jgi:hypothetical protein
MKTLKQIFDIIETAEISIDEYKEKNFLCGYELNAYTSAGVNEILFLDFREADQDPENVEDFIQEFENYLDARTIDEMIDRNRQSETYKSAFTLKESLADFTKFDEKLRGILKEIQATDKAEKEEEAEEKRMEHLGKEVASLLFIKPNIKGEFSTDFGSKTAIGLGRTIDRILEDYDHEQTLK